MDSGEDIRALEAQIKDAFQFIEPGFYPTIIVTRGSFIGEPDTEEYRWAQYAYIVDTQPASRYKSTNGIVVEHLLGTAAGLPVSRKVALECLWHEVVEPRFMEAIQKRKEEDNVHKRRLRERIEREKDLDQQDKAKMEHRLATQIECSSHGIAMMERYDPEEGFVPFDHRKEMEKTLAAIKQQQATKADTSQEETAKPDARSKLISDLQSKVKHWKQLFDKLLSSHETKINDLFKHEVDVIVNEEGTLKRLFSEHHKHLDSLRSTLIDELDQLTEGETAEALWEQKSAEREAALEGKIHALEDALRVQETTATHSLAEFRSDLLLLQKAQARLRQYEHDTIPLHLQVNQLKDHVSDLQLALIKKGTECEKLKAEKEEIAAEKEDICLTLSAVTDSTESHFESERILCDRVKDLEGVVRELESRQTYLKEENVFYERLSDERAEEINELLANAEGRKKEAKEQASEIEKLKGEMALLKAESVLDPVRDSENLREVIARLNQLIEVRTNEVRQLEAELAQLKHSDPALRAESEFGAIQTALEATIADLETRNIELQASLAANNAEDVAALQASLREQHTARTQLENTLTSYQQTNKTLTEERKKMQQDINTNAEIVAELRAALAADAKTRTRLQDEEVRELEEANAALTENRKTLLQNISINAEDVAFLRAQLAASQTANAELQAQVANNSEVLREEYTSFAHSLGQEIKALTDKHAAERAEMDEASIRETEFHDELIREKDEEISRLASALDHAQEGARQYLQQIEALQMEYVRLEMEMGELKGSVSTLREERGQLVEAQAKHDKLVNRLKEHIDSLNSERAGDNEREIQDLNALVAELNSRLNDLRSGSSTGESHPLQDYQLQLRVLEHQNKARLMRARAEQGVLERGKDAGGGAAECCGESNMEESCEEIEELSAKVSNVDNEQVDIPEYQLQLMILEQQNKKRLLRARSEQEMSEREAEYLYERHDRHEGSAEPNVSASHVENAEVDIPQPAPALVPPGPPMMTANLQPPPAPPIQPDLTPYQVSLMFQEKINIIAILLARAPSSSPPGVDEAKYLRDVMRSITKLVEELRRGAYNEYNRVFRGMTEEVEPKPLSDIAWSLKEQPKSAVEKHREDVARLESFIAELLGEEEAEMAASVEEHAPEATDLQAKIRLYGSELLKVLRQTNTALEEQLEQFQARNEQLIQAEAKLHYQLQLHALENQGCMRMISCLREQQNPDAGDQSHKDLVDWMQQGFAPLRKELEACWAERDALQGKMEAMKTRAKDELEECRDERDELQQQVEELEAQKRALVESEVRNAAAQNANADSIEQLRITLMNSESRHNEALREIGNLNQKLKLFDTEQETAEMKRIAERDELLDTIAERNKERDHFRELYEQLRDDRDELLDTIAERSNERDQFKNSYEQLLVDRDELLDTIQERNNERDQFKNSYEQLLVDRDELLDTIQERNNERDHFKNSYEKLYAERDELLDIIAERSNERDAFKQIYEQLLQLSAQEVYDLGIRAETELREIQAIFRNLKASSASASASEPAPAEDHSADDHSDIFRGLKKDTGDPPFCGLSHGTTDDDPVRHKEGDEISLDGEEEAAVPALDKGKGKAPAEEVEPETELEEDVFQDANSEHDSMAAADGSQRGAVCWMPSEAQKRVVGIAPGMKSAARVDGEEKERLKMKERRASFASSEDSFEMI